MADNRYFIVDVPNPNMSQIYDIVVGTEVTQRFSLDGSKAIVKLPVGDTNNYGVLATATEYTHAEILTEIQGNPVWEELHPI